MKWARSALLAAVFLCLASPLLTTSSPQTSGYYELCELTYTIRPDRTMLVEEDTTFVNTSVASVKITMTKTIPSLDVENVHVLDDLGDLACQLSSGAEGTTISFETRWIEGGEHYTYSVSYAAGGLVSGTGVEYEVSIGGTSAGDFGYENYVINIQGPSGSYLFISVPQAELLESEPPTARYAISIGAHENFEGLRAKFYKYPAFYRLTLEEHATNNTASPTTGLVLDTMLFSDEATWQFSALASSNYPIKTMYVDPENNWHGVFEIGDLASGQTKTVRLELLYEVGIDDPSLTPQDVGTISEVPASLAPYLQPADKWESDNLPIQQRSADVVGGQTNAYLAAEQITNSVVSILNYEIQDIRHGALWALQNNTGDCSEYTDLAIALARAAGIPARAMYGWGYSEENTIGHAWLEFYLPNVGWQPADPTWAETWGDYFCRVDPIHLARNVMGLGSSESGITITYYGAVPSLEENADVVVLTGPAVAQEFIDAAQYAVNLADNLLASSPDDNLQAKQDVAEQRLEQSKATSDGDLAIFYAKSSIRSANEVIMALGKEPTQEISPLSLERLFPFIAAVCIVAAIASGVYAVLRRR